jgi:hypothetical protein
MPLQKWEVDISSKYLLGHEASHVENLMDWNPIALGYFLEQINQR